MGLRRNYKDEIEREISSNTEGKGEWCKARREE